MKNHLFSTAVLSAWVAVAALSSQEASAQSRNNQTWRAPPPPPPPAYRPPLPPTYSRPTAPLGNSGQSSGAVNRPSLGSPRLQQPSGPTANNRPLGQLNQPSIGSPVGKGLAARGSGSASAGSLGGRSAPTGSTGSVNKFAKSGTMGLGAAPTATLPSRTDAIQPRPALTNKFSKAAVVERPGEVAAPRKSNKFAKPGTRVATTATWTTNPDGIGSRKPGDLKEVFNPAAKPDGGGGGGGGGRRDGGTEHPSVPPQRPVGPAPK